jgi:hypothetical protein
MLDRASVRLLEKAGEVAALPKAMSVEEFDALTDRMNGDLFSTPGGALAAPLCQQLLTRWRITMTHDDVEALAQEISATERG